MNALERAEVALRLLGVEPRRTSAITIQCSCPFAPWTHEKGTDRSPSFRVKQREHRAYYRCYACGRWGWTRKMAWEHMALSGRDTPGVTTVLYDPWLESPEEDRAETPIAVLDYAPGGAFARKAGLTAARRQEVEAKQKVPYKPPTEAELARLVAKGVPAMALDRGFTRETCAVWEFGQDERRRRWTFPIRGWDGELLGISSRRTWEASFCFKCGTDLPMKEKDGKRMPAERCESCGMRYEKYLYSPGFPKAEVLFGAHRYVAGSPIVLVEGATDVIMLWQHGVRSPMAVLCADPTEKQLVQVVVHAPKVYAMGDGDAAGWRLNLTVMELMARHHPGVPVAEIRLDGKDPGEMTPEEIRALPGDLFGAQSIARVM